MNVRSFASVGLIFFSFMLSRAAEIIDVSALKDGQNGHQSVDPCQDFYQYACGTWMDKTVIPSNRRNVFMQTFSLEEETDKNLNKILKAYVKHDYSVPSKYARKLADVYSSCVKADATADEAFRYVRKAIKRIHQIDSRADLAQVVAQMNLLGSGSLFGFGSTQSLNDSTLVIGNLVQSGFTLGDRDYYFDTSEKSVEIRQKYRRYIAKIFILLGKDADEAAQIARHILKFETQLAEKAYTQVQLSDPSNINHPMTLAELKKLAPNFDWKTYFYNVGQSHLQNLTVDEPEFFENLSVLLKKINERDLKNYLVWHYVNGAADSMGGRFAKTHFEFWGAYLNGSKQRLPLWQRCTREVENSMGYALAEAYVQTLNGDAIRKKTSDMITTIKGAFAKDLQQLSTGEEAWLDQQTLQAALEKVEMMQQKVGAPEKWRDYSKLDTTSESFLENSLRISRFEALRDLAKIGRPVDKSEWGMMPWEINAYYDRSNNEFVFPFGILQPPSLDLTASDGANFGAFGGGTIGHELTHGFDNSGSQYDSHGNLKNWWTEETKNNFTKKAQCYVDQAKTYKIAAVDMYVDGEQTLEENLSDQGGVKLGYIALDNILATRAEAPPLLGRFTERQQFWLSYAQSWCAKVTPESLRARMTTDEHPPEEFRVNAVLRNRPEFARDFKCAAGAPMAPVHRCSLW